MEIIFDFIVLAVISAKMIGAFCCGNRFSFGQIVIWIGIEIILVQGLCLVSIRNWDLNLTAFLLCIGSSGTYLVWGTLKKQMTLACLGFTLKE